MTEITSDIIITPELEEGAIYHFYEGFHLDYLVLHCLLRIYKPKKIFEIGTNVGTGTKIIKNAVGSDSVVFTLDLPEELSHLSLQHPISEGKGNVVGVKCDLPFVQLRGDSMVFDYSLYPCEAAFCDGEHDYEHPNHEAKELIKNGTNLIIFHDADNELVYKAITNAFIGEDQYDLYRVTDTRIAFAIKKLKNNL